MQHCAYLAITLCSASCKTCIFCSFNLITLGLKFTELSWVVHCFKTWINKLSVGHMHYVLKIGSLTFFLADNDSWIYNATITLTNRWKVKNDMEGKIY